MKHATHEKLSDADSLKSIDPLVVDATGSGAVGEDTPPTAGAEAASRLGKIVACANSSRGRSSFFSRAAIKRGSAPAERRLSRVSKSLESSLLSASLQRAVAIFSTFVANRSILPMSASR